MPLVHTHHQQVRTTLYKNAHTRSAHTTLVIMCICVHRPTGNLLCAHTHNSLCRKGGEHNAYIEAFMQSTSNHPDTGVNAASAQNG